MKVMPSLRKRHYPSIVSVFLITITLISGMAGCDGGGNLLPSENLEIRTWYDLDAIRDNLNGNHTLMNDLDSTTLGYDELASPAANEGKGWQPIGTWSLSAFTGSFDGQGYEISDLFINRPDENFVGLFSYVRGEGQIQDIGLVNVIVTGKRGVGGLVGRNVIGTVSNSYSKGSITGNSLVGGLVGENGGLPPNPSNISDSYSMGSVTGITYVGGLVGYIFNGTVSNCYSTGNVTSDSSYVGGLVGYLEEDYQLESYIPESAIGDIKSEGAVILSEGSIVVNSFWDIETSGQYTSAGGTGKNTTEMQDIAIFSIAGWDIIAVALNETNPAYIWNIVNNVTYPFLGWQS
jgi:hypothetical protein